MPEIRGILETALYVEDVQAASAFYQLVLGLEPLEAEERLAVLSVAPGQVVLLCAKLASKDLGATAHFGDGQLHLAFAIPREALASWHAKLVRLGIEIVAKVKWPRGGVSLYFRDLDGHLIELATPGVWTVY